MPRCKHINCAFQIVITRWIDATMSDGPDFSLDISRDVPESIKVWVRCADCHFESRFNAYNISATDHPSAALKWPTWLLDRLIPIRTANNAVQEACLACGVLPAKLSET